MADSHRPAAGAAHGRSDQSEARLLTLALLSASLAGGLFLPLSLVYFTVLTDISLTHLGVLVTAAGLVALPLPLLAGWLVDRVGAHPVVVAALTLQAAAYVGFVVARQALWVFAVSAVMAAGVRLFWSSVFALVAEHAEAEAQRPVEAWFARVNVARTVGIVVGGVVAGVVISFDRADAYVGLAWAAATGCAVAAVLVLRARPARAGARTDRRDPLALNLPGAGAGYGDLLRDGSFALLLVANTVFALSTLFAGLALPTLVRSALGGPGWLTSALLVTNAALVAVLGPWGGRLAARRRATHLLRRAATLWSVAFLIMATGAVGTLPMAGAVLLTGVAVLSLAEVLHAPASAALVNALAGAQARGRYLAVFQYSFVAAELIGPVTFASLFERAAALPFLAVAVANIVTLPCLVLVRRGARNGLTEGSPRAASQR